MSFYNMAKAKAEKRKEILQEGVEDYFEEAKDLKIGSPESLKPVERKKSYDSSEKAKQVRDKFLKPPESFIEKKAKPKVSGEIGKVPIFD